MAFVSRAHRDTDFAAYPTPDEVGPGSFNLRENISEAPKFVGFATSEARKASYIPKGALVAPGPGNYGHTKFVRRAPVSGAAFRSGSSRFARNHAEEESLRANQEAMLREVQQETNMAMLPKHQRQQQRPHRARQGAERASGKGVSAFSSSMSTTASSATNVYSRTGVDTMASGWTPHHGSGSEAGSPGRTRGIAERAGRGQGTAGVDGYATQRGRRASGAGGHAPSQRRMIAPRFNAPSIPRPEQAHGYAEEKTGALRPLNSSTPEAWHGGKQEQKEPAEHYNANVEAVKSRLTAGCGFGRLREARVMPGFKADDDVPGPGTYSLAGHPGNGTVGGGLGGRQQQVHDAYGHQHAQQHLSSSFASSTPMTHQIPAQREGFNRGPGMYNIGTSMKQQSPSTLQSFGSTAARAGWARPAHMPYSDPSTLETPGPTAYHQIPIQRVKAPTQSVFSTAGPVPTGGAGPAPTGSVTPGRTVSSLAAPVVSIEHPHYRQPQKAEAPFQTTDQRDCLKPADLSSWSATVPGPASYNPQANSMTYNVKKRALVGRLGAFGSSAPRFGVAKRDPRPHGGGADPMSGGTPNMGSFSAEGRPSQDLRSHSAPRTGEGWSVDDSMQMQQLQQQQQQQQQQPGWIPDEQLLQQQQQQMPSSSMFGETASFDDGYVANTRRQSTPYSGIRRGSTSAMGGIVSPVRSSPSIPSHRAVKPSSLQKSTGPLTASRQLKPTRVAEPASFGTTASRFGEPGKPAVSDVPGPGHYGGADQPKAWRAGAGHAAVMGTDSRTRALGSFGTDASTPANVGPGAYADVAKSTLDDHTFNVTFGPRQAAAGGGAGAGGAGRRTPQPRQAQGTF